MKELLQHGKVFFGKEVNRVVIKGVWKSRKRRLRSLKEDVQFLSHNGWKRIGSCRRVVISRGTK